MAEKIVRKDGKIMVPNQVIIPFIEGDGIGPEIWAATKKVVDAAIAKTYNNTKSIEWKEVFAGQKAFDLTGNWLPDETVKAFDEFSIGIKGPLTTPIGGGITSLNVALRQKLDLFACVRPVRHFTGVVSPVKNPEFVNMVIFRENTEDVYAGIEWESGSEEVKKVIDFLIKEMNVKKIRFPETSAIGIKPVSVEGSKRLIRSAIKYALENNRKSLTIVHKGNIQKFTEGGFRKWGYELAKEEFGDKVITWDECNGQAPNGKLLIQESIADAFLQKILLNPKQFDVVATTNLNGDYISDALAAQVGGIGIAPGANINYATGAGIFEATHGTAPNSVGKNRANPCSLLLSAEMLVRHLGWTEAADKIVVALEKTFAQKFFTRDLAILRNDATMVSTSEFAEKVIANL